MNIIISKKNKRMTLVSDKKSKKEDKTDILQIIVLILLTCAVLKIYSAIKAKWRVYRKRQEMRSVDKEGNV